MERQFVPEYTATFTDGELCALKAALENALKQHRDNGFKVETAPEHSQIGTQRDLLTLISAIRLGNRMGTDKFKLRMVEVQ